MTDLPGGHVPFPAALRRLGRFGSFVGGSCSDEVFVRPGCSRARTQRIGDPTLANAHAVASVAGPQSLEREPALRAAQAHAIGAWPDRLTSSISTCRR